MNRKIAAILISIVILMQLIMVCVKVAETNKNRYYVDAYCEYENGELIFTFYDNDFIWTLGKGDKIPTDNFVLLVMDNNGTENFLQDDVIISYK